MQPRHLVWPRWSPLFPFVSFLLPEAIRDGAFHQGEEFLVNPLPFVQVGMQVDLGGLDGGMPQVLLDHPQVLRPAVEFGRIAVPDLVRGDTLGSIPFEYVLD